MTKEQIAEQWLLTGQWRCKPDMGDPECYTDWSREVKAFVAGMESERSKVTQLLEAARLLNTAVDEMWNDPNRLQNKSWHEKNICAKQRNLSSALKPFEK